MAVCRWVTTCANSVGGSSSLLRPFWSGACSDGSSTTRCSSRSWPRFELTKRGHDLLEQRVVLEPSEHAPDQNGRSSDDDPPTEFAQVVTQRHTAIRAALTAQYCHV